METHPKPDFPVLLIHQASRLTAGFEDALRQSVSHPVIFDSAQTALVFIQNSNEIGLIFVAIDLPDMSGFETVNKIRVDRKSLPIVMLTHYLTVETMKVAMACGCNEVIKEPVSRKMLQSILQKYLLNTSDEN